MDCCVQDTRGNLHKSVEFLDRWAKPQSNYFRSGGDSQLAKPGTYEEKINEESKGVSEVDYHYGKPGFEGNSRGSREGPGRGYENCAA